MLGVQVVTTDQSEGVEKMLKEILRGNNGSKRRRRWRCSKRLSRRQWGQHSWYQRD